MNVETESDQVQHVYIRIRGETPGQVSSAVTDYDVWRQQQQRSARNKAAALDLRRRRPAKKVGCRDVRLVWTISTRIRSVVSF